MTDSRFSSSAQTRVVPLPLELLGNGHARGLLHGHSQRDQILETLEFWRQGLASHAGDEIEVYIDQFVTGTGFLAAARRWAPDLVAEVEGLAEALDLPFQTLFAFQCADEEFWYASSRSKKTMIAEKCTAFALAHEGRIFAGQNLDIGKWVDGRQLLLRIKGDGPESLVYTFGGFIGANGLNAAGVGVCVNTLLQLRPDPDGLPVAFVVRQLLTHTSLAEARSFLCGIRHASGQTYTVADPDGFAVFECSAGDVKELHAGDHEAWVAHTNHPIVNTDLALSWRSLLQHDPATAADMGTGSERRLSQMQARLARIDSGSVVDALEAALSSSDDARYPICRDDIVSPAKSAIGFTVGAMVYELLRPPILHLAWGPPCRHPFMSYGFGGADFAHSNDPDAPLHQR